MTIVRNLGFQEYLAVWNAMKQFTFIRDENTQDEIWYLEHPPVYTQGQAGKKEHVLNPGSIPIVQSDRGGQVTYHGPGQLVMYVLFDIQRLKIGIRSFVSILEKSIINLLAHYQIVGETQCKAPGVYIEGKKIASIGLRVKNGRTYHGIALNVCTDLTPFSGINPCGYKALEMTNMSTLVENITICDIIPLLTQQFLKTLGQ